MSSIRSKICLLLAVYNFPSGSSPFGLGIFTPVPIQPWVSERMEQKYNNKNDGRAPIMPPIRDGYPPPICEDPPGDLEILRAIPRVARGVPYVYEQFHDDIKIVKNRMVDKIDPPRSSRSLGQHSCTTVTGNAWSITPRQSRATTRLPAIRKRTGFRLSTSTRITFTLRRAQPGCPAASYSGHDQVLM